MALSNVAGGDPVLASTMNQIIANVNGSPGRAVFTQNGSWSVPNGVHSFKVYATGGGGCETPGYMTSGEDPTWVTAIPGKSSPLVSAIFSNVDIGTTFVITVGAGGTGGSPQGGTTSFGTSISVTGGTPTVSGSVTSAPAGWIHHANSMFVTGPDGSAYGASNTQGLVVIEW